MGFGLVFLVTIGINFHMAALVSDFGGSPELAATAVAALGLTSLIARLGTGVLLDLLPFKTIATVFFLGQMLGCLLLATMGINYLLMAVVLLGAAQGAELDMLPYVIARRFGAVSYSQIFGSAYAVLSVGQIISPILLGKLFGWTAAYTTGFVFFAVLSVLALLLLSFSSIAPHKSRDLQTS